MLGFFARRLLSAFLTLLVVSVLAFSLIYLAGDPAIAIAGKEASPEDVARVRAHYGFDQPLALQFWNWGANALVGDFGTSIHYRRPVSELLITHIPVTLTLAMASIVFALSLAIPLGVLSAIKPGSVVDRLTTVFSVIGQAMPTFWLALLLVILFSLTLRWLPVSGSDGWVYYVMPVIALGYYSMPVLLRLTRVGMIEALDSDYIRTARASGIPTRKILFKHALRNVLIPIVSISAVQLGSLLAGSIVIEQIFALRGLGWLSYDATLRADLPVLQAIVLIVAAFYVLLTFLADLLNAALDPRIRLA